MAMVLIIIVLMIIPLISLFDQYVHGQYKNPNSILTADYFYTLKEIQEIVDVSNYHKHMTEKKSPISTNFGKEEVTKLANSFNYDFSVMTN